MIADERFEKLEKELADAKRRNRNHNSWLLAAMGLIIVGLVVLRCSGVSGSKEIRANKFLLVDENGNARAGLSVHGTVPELVIFDETGKLRVLLNVDKNGPSLTLGDENEKPRAALHVTKAGPGLVFLDENGKPIWSAH